MESAIVIWWSKLNTKKYWLVFGLIFCAFSSNGLKASAQITPDSTLTNNSVVLPDASGNLIEITEGTTAGNNLFHSFQEFSVPNGQTAFFNNGATIENILGRVTGSSVSNIEGLIRANGSANLFLINPNGIVFGENASLDIGGSFLGSTANSIQLSDGSEFSAVNPQAPSLLEINIPVGLQYGSEAGNIIVEGAGNSTGFTDPGANDYALIKDFRPAGLQVDGGKSLALIGGNIALDGGNLTAAEGHIELGSVTEGLVKFDSDGETWSFDYQDVAGFKDIALANAASVEVSGNSSGIANIQGQNITLTDASAILANTSGDGTAGSINLNGAESVQITGVSQSNIPFVTYVSTDTTTGSTGAGADLNINTDYLLVAGGAQVASAVFGSGDGGTLSVDAERVNLISGSPLAGSSGLFAPIVPGATGDGGDINLEADSLLVAGGAQAFTVSVSSSKAGDFNINVRDIELNGTSPNGTPSGLIVNTRANGDGGNLTINTENLSLVNGAVIGSSVTSSGKAGEIEIDADTIEMNGIPEQGLPSVISAFVGEAANGTGGDITIETDSLKLTDGTQINTTVAGAGTGGNINVAAEEIDLAGLSSLDNKPSALFSTVERGATGESGNLTIATNSLRVSEGAQIAVSTGGSGSAGDLTLTASSVELTGNAIAEGGGSSGLFSSAVLADGSGGSIDLTTDQLSVKDGATISASNFLSGSNANVPPGTGRAGNINIDADIIELDGIDNDTPASITAATFAGGGGNIVLNSDTMTANNGGQVTVETSGVGAGGSIEIDTDDLNLSSNAVFSSSAIAEGDAGTISLVSDRISISSGSRIVSNSTGLGQAGNMFLVADLLNLDEAEITATSVQTGGGDINLTIDSLNLDNNSLISTSVLDSTGGGGNIAIDNDGFIIGRNNSDIRADAVLGNGGNIQITSQGLFLDAESEITASSQFGVDGIVEINDLEFDKLNIVQLPQRISTPEAVVVSSCPASKENTFAVTGLGGIPQNPGSYLKGTTVWQDARLLLNSTNADLRSDTNSYDQKAGANKGIVESQAWVINQQGNVELVAAVTPQIGQQGIRCGDRL